MIKAFLSHSSIDKDLVKLVHDRLTTESAWFDSTNIENGECIPEKVSEGIRHATHFVLFWSHKASVSLWVRAELNAAFVQMMSGKCKLMVFTLDDAILPELLAPYKYELIDKSDLAKAANMIAEKILSQEGAISRLSDFVNRTKELGVIEESIRSGNKLVILNGILGIGKSSLAERAIQWVYPNRSTSRIILDFNSIPGIAELSIELSRLTKKPLINDNSIIEFQKKNICYFFECISSSNTILVLKDVKKWLDEDGSPNPDLLFIIKLILDTKMFEYASIMTSTRYITLPNDISQKVNQIPVRGMDDTHIAEIISNNLTKNFVGEIEKNREFAKRLHGYPLGAKLGAYRISNHGYEYYLKQPQKINELKVGLAKQLISYASLSPECIEYLKIVAICQSRLRNDEYATAFPDFESKIARLSDEAFFAGILKFDDDSCYKLEPLVEDYFYDIAFNASNRKELSSALERYLLEVTKNGVDEQYLRLIPTAVHILTINGKIGEAITLRSELTATITSSMWDQYNHREYEEANASADGLIEIDPNNIEAQYVKSLCLTRFDEYEKAEMILKRLLDSDFANSARYYYALGRIQKRKCNYLSAIDYFQSAVTQKRNYLSPYREMSDCYLHMNRVEEAQAAIEKAKTIDDSNVFVLLLEARLLQKIDRADAAIELLSSQSLLEQDPAQIYFRKGRAYDQLGRKSEAKDCYRKSLDYNPKTYDAKLCLLNHQIIDEPKEAAKELAELKPILRGKRRYILTNIEARFIGYQNHDEDCAIETLDSVPFQYRDKQWYAVKHQLLENLVSRHSAAGREILADTYARELDKVSRTFEDKYGEKKIVETDLIPDA